MNNNIGIILNLDFNNRKIILFDRNLGKLQLNFPRNFKKTNNLCNGILINYNLEQDKLRAKLKINNINIIDLPYDLAKKDILFFHHVLELCNFFIPIGVIYIELFDLIYFSCFLSNNLEDLNFQKIILTKFFLLIGLYPENDIMKPYFNYILFSPIDRITEVAINLEKDLEIKKELSLWLAQCISMHPYFRLFKTVNIIKKIIV